MTEILTKVTPPVMPVKAAINRSSVLTGRDPHLLSTRAAPISLRAGCPTTAPFPRALKCRLWARKYRKRGTGPAQQPERLLDEDQTVWHVCGTPAAALRIGPGQHLESGRNWQS